MGAKIQINSVALKERLSKNYLRKNQNQKRNRWLCPPD